MELKTITVLAKIHRIMKGREILWHWIIISVPKRSLIISAAARMSYLQHTAPQDVIADNGKVNKEALENVDGVKGMFESNGQLQLIIGTGTVNKVYDEFLAITGASAASKEEVKAAAAAKQPLYIRLLKPIGDVFVPILPAIVASGLMMGLVEALGNDNLPFGPAFKASDWYGFLDTVANTAFAYLPVIVAVSAARVFGGNIFLGAVIGLLMIHSAFLNGWNVANVEAVAKYIGKDINGVSPYLIDWTENAKTGAITIESLGGICPRLSHGSTSMFRR